MHNVTTVSKMSKNICTCIDSTIQISFYRTTTNVLQNDAQNANNNNDEDNRDAVIEAHNAQDPVDAQSYDACKAHKFNVTKRQQSIEIFQDKLLKTLEAPQSPQAPENQDYLDLAMALMAAKIKSILSNNEIMD